VATTANCRFDSPKTRSALHRHAQRNAFRRPEVRRTLLFLLFANYNQGSSRAPHCMPTPPPGPQLDRRNDAGVEALMFQVNY
jgi:hypothetical protein